MLRLVLSRLGFAIFAQPWLGFDALWWAFPFSSVINSGIAAAYYLHGGWKKVVLADTAEKVEHKEASALGA